MNSSDFFIARTDKYILVRRIGKRNIPIVSDATSAQISSIYQKICAGDYRSERELFQDIYNRYSSRSVLPLLNQV